ncbi:odorant receptor 13a-like [Camponotus floridanus]|uniref:odorant receptor 13a-like n=1 Tax=Camponotus floridanus TaxID=104421 RepID=UPI000DC6BC9B|nr:odorant receptor 13a-like [Camponotus floridanus]
MNFNKELHYAFTLSRQCMRIVGIWPDLDVPLNVCRRPKIAFIFATCIMTLYVLIPQVLNLLRTSGKSVSQMVELFVAPNITFMAICKLIITKYHGDKLRILIASSMTDLMTSKNNWERNTMLNLVRTGRKISITYFVIAIAIIIFACYIRLENVFQNIHQPRRYLVYRFDYIQKSPNYEITCFIQICGAIYAIFGNYSVDSFISILLLHICAQLINLRTALNNLINKLNNKPISSSKFKKGLAAIIVRHEYLIRNVKTINDCYSSVLCIHVLCGSFQLCLVAFQTSTMIADNSNVHLIKIIFLAIYISFILTQLYVYCYAAERLLMESTNMAFGMYECKWYNIPAKDAKDLMLIVYQSAISLKLTAGIFGNFSMELFGIAIKTTMGYLSALLTIA